MPLALQRHVPAGLAAVPASVCFPREPVLLEMMPCPGRLADAIRFGIVLVSMLGTGSQRAKVFFSALPMAGAALGKALVFLGLQSAVLKQEQEPPGFALTCRQLFR